MDDFKKLIDEYSPDYTLFLEGTYGDNMLTEGGTVAIDKMFDGTDLHHKKALDIGFGLGAAVFHLADKYEADITGIELNPWMVEEATRRIPQKLLNQVRFVQYEKPPLLPFPDHSFDIVYSKGVLVHINDKTDLFHEIHRVLKPNGFLIIDDWLSPIKNKWSERIQRMCEIENLTLYAQTEDDYKNLLKNTGFKHIQMRDENIPYAQYDQDIVDRLKKPDIKKSFCEKFGETAWSDAIEGYQLIADAIRNNELLIRWFKAST